MLEDENFLKCQKCFVGNTGNPFAAQACVELLPGYPPENCRVPSQIEKKQYFTFGTF